MVKKLIKIFKVILICECAILLIICINACSSKAPVSPDVQKSNSPAMKAYSTAASSEIESYVFTLTGVNLENVDGTNVQLWSGTQEVDLAKTTALSDVVKFNGDLTEGTYKSITLYGNSKLLKVKGFVTVGGVKYYTKTAHTGYNAAPAEPEELAITGSGGDGFAMQQTFPTPVKLGGTVSEVHLLIDLANHLSYYDGTGPSPKDTNTTTAGMYLLFPLTSSLVIGAPGKKEAYDITSVTGNTGSGRYVIIFDSADNIVGSVCKNAYKDNAGETDGYGLYGDAAITKNADGSLKILLTGNFETAYTHTLPAFKRETHTGTFTSTETRYPTGSYTATKVE